MPAQIIKGAEIAKEIRAELKTKVDELQKKGITPGLFIIRVGEDPASVSYVTAKTKASEELGIMSETLVYPDDTKEEVILAKIEELNKDPKWNGMLVQLPLPKHIDEDKVLNLIDPKKDVDGFHPVNVGKLLIGDPYFMPCTPHGVQELLVRSGNDPDGKHVVVCGRSNIVGKPVAAILMQKKKGANATVTIVHTGTKDMASIVKQADIVIAAMGKAKAITADMVKEGAVVIDVGVNQVGTTAEGKRILVGDSDFEALQDKVKAITPVPGGVGPMTVTMLMMNTVRAAEMQAGSK